MEKSLRHLMFNQVLFVHILPTFFPEYVIRTTRIFESVIFPFLVGYYTLLLLRLWLKSGLSLLRANLIVGSFDYLYFIV